jgi:hypothetical protein
MEMRLKTELTGRRQRSALDCSVIEEEEGGLQFD